MDGLVGDIGGTNARFALASLEAGRPVVRDALSLPNRDYPSAEAAIAAYLARVKPLRRPERIVVAVAGPVVDGRAHMTNLDWDLSEQALRQLGGFSAARLINDFTAQTLGAVAVGHEGLLRLGPEAPGDPQATIAVMGPGTGFGCGALVRDGRRELVLASEGGHIAFAPVDEVEVEVMKRLQAQFGRVSVERILSGPGLHDLYLALCDIEGEPPSCADAPQIQAAADAGDRLAALALERFVLILGSTAGDLALAMGARGGVYITGGVAQKLAARIAVPGFRERFEAKGRFVAYMRAIPTWLVKDDYAGLFGSASLLGDLETA